VCGCLRVKVILLPKNEAGILYNRGGLVGRERQRGSEKDRARRRPDRVTARQIGNVFAGVTRAGAASGRPYEEKGKCAARYDEANGPRFLGR
jgi:hypothetical protein